jgi:hypothetical protein
MSDLERNIRDPNRGISPVNTSASFSFPGHFSRLKSLILDISQITIISFSRRPNHRLSHPFRPLTAADRQLGGRSLQVPHQGLGTPN